MKRVLFLLGHLNDLDIEWMINNGNKEDLEAGDRLIRKGEAIENLYIVLSGQLSITDGLSEKNIALIGAGEIVGEMSFLESRPPSVSVIATQSTSVYSISRKLMDNRLSDNLEFKANFYYAISLFLSNRLRKTTSQLGYGNPEELDVIDENILDGISQAGSRFGQILQKFSEV
ncbi:MULTISPECIES: cyclic nucleotide-binding domain-containing protein [unclassified Tenacibaculum]|uniref:cyclic nucleotide-binding domain-containing protein n=1 Tax=unclassified Tenacibaculum TaxID=2635139 RepID=UPI001F3353DA|nr:MULTISPECIES: cyclic nucleotide-binding domain-containing protein [unclassified Tenacibaculum]MCF2873153.1 cyclic nucleotide-binding domain-containing protein [Tenacibaculum sp. Cn5-1]MCF2933309.1 cyclic nucleotide-binding domain-containing protein [Tenacibaculum sp. Cn5-34]MCG7510110.1 cyclic nucleotide-binding domain-containing protein [Tenacibaculum sp. Cn5-46]